MQAFKTKICEECKGIGTEIFIDSDGTERLGAGFCPSCIGRGQFAWNADKQEWEIN